MGRGINLAIWGVCCFCYGRGTEIMWPDLSAWTWWAMGTGFAVLGVVTHPTMLERIVVPWWKRSGSTVARKTAVPIIIASAVGWVTFDNRETISSWMGTVSPWVWVGVGIVALAAAVIVRNRPISPPKDARRSAVTEQSAEKNAAQTIATQRHAPVRKAMPATTAMERDAEKMAQTIRMAKKVLDDPEMRRQARLWKEVSRRLGRSE